MGYLTNCKKALTIIMAVLILAGTVLMPVSASTFYNAGGGIRTYYGTRSKVYYDGKKISSSKRYGLYYNDNFLIPYKRMMVDKGPKMTASFNKSTKVLMLTYNNKTIRIQADSKKIYVNGIRKSNLNTAPMMVNMEGTNLMVIPAKRICAEMGLDYSYNSSTREIFITGTGTIPSADKPAASNSSSTSQTMVSAVNGVLKATAFQNLTTAAFIGLLGPVAQADYHKSGILASVTLAQAINESGWGKTELARKGNNIFGMKINLSGNTWSGSVWDGKSYVNILTTEEYHGKKVKITAKFRKYKSVAASIADHSAYLANAMNGNKRRYYGITNTKKYSEQLNIIRKGGYCTWSSYVSELTKLIKKYNLTKYDK